MTRRPSCLETSLSHRRRCFRYERTMRGCSEKTIRSVKNDDRKTCCEASATKSAFDTPHQVLPRISSPLLLFFCYQQLHTEVIRKSEEATALAEKHMLVRCCSFHLLHLVIAPIRPVRFDTLSSFTPAQHSVCIAISTLHVHETSSLSFNVTLIFLLSLPSSHLRLGVASHPSIHPLHASGPAISGGQARRAAVPEQGEGLCLARHEGRGREAQRRSAIGTGRRRGGT